MVAYSVYTTLLLLNIEKYFSLSLLVWLLAYVGLCFSAYTAVNSEYMHTRWLVNIVYLMVAGMRQNVFLYMYLSFICCSD